MYNVSMQCRRPQFNSWVGKIQWRRDRLPIPVFLGFPGGSVGKESACNAGDLGLIPGLGIPWRRERVPTLVFWPGEFHGQYSPWGRKELDTTEWLSLHFSQTEHVKNTSSHHVNALFTIYRWSPILLRVKAKVFTMWKKVAHNQSPAPIHLVSFHSLPT